MKRVVTTILGLICALQLSYAVRHTINTSGTTFSPANTEMNLGDTIVFNVEGGHTATEVSQSTWNSNGTTPNGIFNLSPGNNQLVVGLSLGTHYYVCQVHVGGMGMKGTISVSPASHTKQNVSDVIKIFPNPVNNMIQWEYAGKDLKRVSLISADGKILKNWNLSSKVASIAIDDLPAGNYFLAGYSDEKELWIEQFQKQ